jgi:hypothetical protein
VSLVSFSRFISARGARIFYKFTFSFSHARFHTRGHQKLFIRVMTTHQLCIKCYTPFKTLLSSHSVCCLVLARTQRKKIKISRPIFQRHFLLLGEKLPESREVLCALCLLQLDAMETRPTPPFLSMTRHFFIYVLKIHFGDYCMGIMQFTYDSGWWAW